MVLHQPLSVQDIEEIIDQIFLPLVRPRDWTPSA